MRQIRIAALITCHNRREKTIACFDALWKQEALALESIKLSVYLVDDGCTDGTAEAVIRKYPQTRGLKGEGNLYWCGGMRLAWSEAMQHDYDYYLWLNDDAVLFSGALSLLLKTAFEVKNSYDSGGIIVGTTCDPVSEVRTYGGVKQASRFRPLDFIPVYPTDKPQRCDTMNGNCVLVPREIAEKIGNLSPDFTHGIGDFDYGLRARDRGVPIWVVPNYVAYCSGNTTPGWANSANRFQDRWAMLHRSKGLTPTEWTIFLKRHAKNRWPWYMLKLYARVLFPQVWKWVDK